MRKTLPALLAAVALLLGLAASSAAVVTPAAAAVTNPAVYLVPHQDDEMTSMGPDLISHVQAGREVVLIQFTDGSRTGVCTSPKFGLNYAQPECTAARDAEMHVGTNLIGVDPDNIFHPVDPATGKRPDDFLSKGAAVRILAWAIADIEARYPGSTPAWKTMSWGDDHSGHRVMGEALREAYQRGEVDDVRFFLKRNEDASWPSRPSGSTKTISLTIQPGTTAHYRLLGASYSYGIGNLSGGHKIEYMRNQMKSVVHDAVR